MRIKTMAKSQTDDRLNGQVQQIAESITNPTGWCWDCEQEVERDSDGDIPETCPDCEGNEVGEMSAIDYLSDALDIEYTVSSSGDFLGARVLVAFGGPNIWIDTRQSRVEGYWWGSKAFASFTDNMGLYDTLEEFYSCR